MHKLNFLKKELEMNVKEKYWGKVTNAVRRRLSAVNKTFLFQSLSLNEGSLSQVMIAILR